MSARRAMLIGLDCAPPALVFERLRDRLPVLRRLMREGAWGPLRSVVPPITVPAWTCMLSGRDPGELGLYGFRNRVPGTSELRVARDEPHPTPKVWDVASAAGKTSCVMYVPTASPPRALDGVHVGGFLHEGDGWVWPPELATELEARFGAHTPDVDSAAREDPGALLDALYESTARRFRVARALYEERAPDLFAMVEMGPDRLHHGMFAHLDPAHPAHDPRWAAEAADYYAFLDAEVGALIDRAPEDTVVIVASDHGARAKRGSVRLNEWLRREGWLALDADGAIDPARTRAWSTGGYYARVFFNVAGRDQGGAVAADALDAEVDRLVRELGRIGVPLRAHRPRELYRDVRGAAPELLVVLDDLALSASGELGEGPIVREEPNDVGCVHDWDGIFLARGLGARGRIDDLVIHDVGATLLGALGVRAPEGWLGRDLARSRGGSLRAGDAAVE
ncbi:MAG: alkaline phosphatase family protein [Sandaracinaceae bacterium]